MNVNDLNSYETGISPTLRHSLKAPRQGYVFSEQQNKYNKDTQIKEAKIKEKTTELKRKKKLLEETVRELHEGGDNMSIKSIKQKMSKNQNLQKYF